MTKRISISSSEPPRRQRGSLNDWAVALVGLLFGLLLVSIVVGSLAWVALRIWTSVLSMM